MKAHVTCCVCLALAWGLAGAVDAASVYQDIDGLVVMEAENFTESAGRTDPQKYLWRISTTTPGFVGSGYVDTPYATGTDATWANGCEATYKFMVAQNATYRIWVRRYAPYGWNDSCFVGLDGVQFGNQGNTANYGQWIWVDRGTMDVVTGSHVFYLRRLESGYMVDRIVLARTTGYTPVNEGPAETFVVYSPIHPAPADGTPDVSRDIVLSWKPGQFARTHDVYFGTARDAVTDASRTDPRNVLLNQSQDANSYDPAGPLEYGQTYYWRVDDVGAAPGATTYKGDVWSFTIEPYAYPAQNTTATSSGSYEAGSEPAKMLDGSGLNNADEHSTDAGAMWLTTFGEPAPLLQYDLGGVRKLHEMWVWNYNVDVEPVLGFGLKDVRIEYSTDGVKWTALGSFVLAQGPGLPGYAHNTTIAFGDAPVRYVQLTVQSTWGGLPQYGLAEVRFLCIPTQARDPQPAGDTTGVDRNIALLWKAHREAVEHKVYFGTDKQAVVNGTALIDTVTESSCTPPVMNLATTYYWRVDEVNQAQAVPSWPGDMWSFTTTPYEVVDDFESYTDETGHCVFDTWSDGFTSPGVASPTNGALVGYDNAPYAERTIIHGGRQSMPLRYGQSTATVSEAQRTFDTPQDWTALGIKTLVLYFRGAATNTAGRLYVTINDSKVLYPGATTAIAQAQWTAWTIDLAPASNLRNVRTLTIGVDNGGSGILYIDDILLSALQP